MALPKDSAYPFLKAAGVLVTEINILSSWFNVIEQFRMDD